MPSERPDNLHLRIIVSAVLVALFLALGAGVFYALYSMRKDPEKSERRPPLTVVRVVTATRGEFLERIEGYGRARALRSADVSAEVPGVVARVAAHLEAGMAVTAGEEMVWLERREFETALATARARKQQVEAAVDGLAVTLENTKRRLELARSDLDAAERELARVKDLAEEEVVTKSELDRQRITKSLTEKEVVSLESQRDATEKDLIRARAEVAAAEAALDRANLDLERTTIRAPFTGRIVERRVSPGTRVAPGTVLLTLVDLSRVEVPVALGASRYGEVDVGAPASIRRGNGDETLWTGRVARVSPTVNDRDRTWSVFLVVDGTPLANPMPPGSFVLAEIEGRRYEDVIPVPRVAFVADRVYLATGTDTEEALVVAKEPRVLRMLPSTALVVSGLDPGARVIVTNLEQIADGARVRVTAEAAPE